MSELPQYSPDAKCPKCGHDRVFTAYHQAGDTWCGTGCPLNQHYQTPEHLCRTCERCRYSWVESPLEVTKQ